MSDVAFAFNRHSRGKFTLKLIIFLLANLFIAQHSVFGAEVKEKPVKIDIVADRKIDVDGVQLGFIVTAVDPDKGTYLVRFGNLLCQSVAMKRSDGSDVVSSDCTGGGGFTTARINQQGNPFSGMVIFHVRGEKSQRVLRSEDPWFIWHDTLISHTRYIVSM